MFAGKIEVRLKQQVITGFETVGKIEAGKIVVTAF